MATSLKIDDALKGRVQNLARQRRRLPHWIMLEAIQLYVEREEARESLCRKLTLHGLHTKKQAGTSRVQRFEVGSRSGGAVATKRCLNSTNDHYAGGIGRLERCRRFLKAKAPEAAELAGQAISRQIVLLEDIPEVGRPLPEAHGLRELIIPFGESGYVGLYRHERDDDAVYLLAFRHQKEAGY